MIATRIPRLTIFKHSRFYYLELKQESLKFFDASSKLSTLIEIPLSQTICLKNKLGNINGFVTTMQRLLAKQTIKSQYSWVISAPYLTQADQAEQPFCLLQLLLTLTKAGIEPKSIITNTCITANTFNYQLYTNSRNLLTPFHQHNKNYTIPLLFAILCSVAGLLYFLTNTTTTLHNKLTGVDAQILELQASANKATKNQPPSFYKTFKTEPALSPHPILTTLTQTIPDDCVLYDVEFISNNIKNKPLAHSKNKIILHGYDITTHSIHQFVRQLNTHNTNNFIFTLQNCSLLKDKSSGCSYSFTIEGTDEATY